MRLWHKDLICALPKKQLLGQWRECCLIAKNISEMNTPNHILVNKIMNYPLSHFYRYCEMVEEEMKNRGYKCNFDKITKYMGHCSNYEFILKKDVFNNWHNKRYFRQCYLNLQEKYDCGAIPLEEWKKIMFYIYKNT